MKITLKDKIRPMNPVHGVGNGPAKHPFHPKSSHVQDFIDAGIPFSRTHDTQGIYGAGEYINIHCIFKNFDADVNDPASYNFKNTDLYIEKIISAGTQVFYRLGETIENQPIATNLPRYIHPPKDFQKWAEICEHIIRHYNEGWADGFHYDIKYWEIWNEPDNTQMWTGTPEEFYEFYSVVANHLKSCFPHLKIGGPSSSGFYAATRLNPSDWFKTLIPFAEGFMEYITSEEHKAPLDFFSWHCYTHVVDEMTAAARYARAFLDKYGFTETESFLTEWNYAVDWDEEEVLYRRSMPVAAMVAGCIMTMQNEGVDGGMYYDAEVEHYCGIYTVITEKRAKPYYAFLGFNALKQLGTQIETEGFEFGKGYYAIAAANDKEAAIMISNFNAEDTEIEIDASRYGKSVDIYLLDDTYNMEVVYSFGTEDGRFKVEAKKNSVMVIKIR